MASKRLKTTLLASPSHICRQCLQNERGIPLRRRLATAVEIEASTSVPDAAITTTPLEEPAAPVEEPPPLYQQFRHGISSRIPRNLFPHADNPFLTTAPVTLYTFPHYKPVSSTSYPSTHLLLPLRRDILHKAIVHEGDRTRQGTASTKWRNEVHGSTRKLRPQKGTGSARLGDKKSPMLRGGGVAFGPKPRDFATGLNKKIYDLAWRTALSFRYRRGALVVLEGEAEIEEEGPGAGRWVREMLAHNGWGKKDGGSVIVTNAERPKLFAAVEDELEKRAMRGQVKVIPREDVDVKNLLEMGRLIIERAALDKILREHSSDLKTSVMLKISAEQAEVIRQANFKAAAAAAAL